MYKKVLGKHVKPSVLVEGIQKGELLTIDFKDNNQVNDSDLIFTTEISQHVYCFLPSGKKLSYPCN